MSYHLEAIWECSNQNRYHAVCMCTELGMFGRHTQCELRICVDIKLRMCEHCIHNAWTLNLECVGLELGMCGH